MPGNRKYDLVSGINVTPLVDVVLVLLIIFMVTAPMMNLGMDVDLPESHATAIPTKQERLVITINKEKKIFINDYEVTLASLGTKLRGIYQNRPQKGVFLRADKSLPYGLVVNVMSIIKEAGIYKLGMITQPLKEKPARFDQTLRNHLKR